MTDRSSRIFDDLGRFFTNASGAMRDVRDEIEGFICARLDRALSDMDVVRREEFDVVRDMARKAREEVLELRGMIEQGSASSFDGRGGAQKKATTKPAPSSRKKKPSSAKTTKKS